MLRRLRKTGETGSAGPLNGQLALTEPAIEGRTHVWLPRVAVATLVLLIVLGAAAGYLAWSNKARADDWRARSAVLQAKATELDGLLTARTATLNERTVELNGLADKVAAAEQAIERSEADVKRLERRQKALAAEKANVEDARAALALQTTEISDVASAYIACKDGLTALLNLVLANNYIGATGIAPNVDRDCSSAESSLQSYLSRYG